MACGKGVTTEKPSKPKEKQKFVDAVMEELKNTEIFSEVSERIQNEFQFRVKRKGERFWKKYCEILGLSLSIL